VVEAVKLILRPLPLVLALTVLPSAALAHRVDECLQATIVAIEPGELRLRMNLTPGAAVAEPVISLIDRDRDGVISADEAAAYARSLRRDLTVRLDGRDVELTVLACEADAPANLRTGSGIIRAELAGAIGPLAPGNHAVTLENRHLAPVSVYLVNAAAPKGRAIRIVRQARNDNQSVGDIQVSFEPAARSSSAVAMKVSIATLGAVLAGLGWARKRGLAPA
jgi:hypothetical protein